MRELILSHEAAIRLGFFVGVLAVMAVWEGAAPRRPATLGRWARWPSHLGIVALNTVVVRLLLPTTAVALAMVGEREGWGLLYHVALPGWLALTDQGDGTGVFHLAPGAGDRGDYSLVLVARDGRIGSRPSGTEADLNAVSGRYAVGDGGTLLDLGLDPVGAIPTGTTVDLLDVWSDPDGAWITAADGTLAGSILELDQALRNLIDITGCALGEALETMTTTPAKLLGLEGERGRIAPGFAADMVLLSSDLRVQTTIASGEVVYTA